MSSNQISWTRVRFMCTECGSWIPGSKGPGPEWKCSDCGHDKWKETSAPIHDTMDLRAVQKFMKSKK